MIKTTEHKAHFDADSDSYQDVVMRYVFDIKGQLLESIDPYGQTISANTYSTAGQLLRTKHIDRGMQNLVADALNLPVITNDAKKARTLHSFDNLQRPTFVWARDNGNEKITKRQILQYGDNAGISNPEKWNLKGKLYAHNDEAGKLVYEEYDFQANNTEFFRQVINDDALTPYQKYIVDWDNFNPNHLSETKNRISQSFDALNRIRKAQYPQDLDGQRKEMIPKYNKGGALLALKVDSTDYVKEVAYNARGQRILIAMGNNIMTRYAYDTETFRVLRQRSALYKHSGHTYAPNAGIRQDLQYTYDLEGTITTTNDVAPANTYAQGPGNLLRKFNHDPLRRLISATGREISNVYQQPSWDLNIRPMDYTDTNTYTRSYQYDKLGNIQYLSHKAAGHTNQDFDRDYTYGSSDNKLRAFTVNSNLFQNKYDPSGNLAQEGQSRFYEWTANDKMAVFKIQAGSSTPSVYTNYFYNARGERIKKHTRKGNKITVTFYMAGGMFETSYVKPSGGSIDNNKFYNTIHILDQSNNGNNRVATIRVGKNVADKTPAVQYIVGDHLNNSTAVLKITGTLINREEFYPFGETSFGGFQYKRYRYNGKEKDEDSGLYEYGQRYYAPWVCRFVSVDPISESYPQLSSYNYAGNKPITSPDIEGLQGKVDKSSDNSKMRTLEQTGNPKIQLKTLEVHGNPKLELTGLESTDTGSTPSSKDAPETTKVGRFLRENLPGLIAAPLAGLVDSITGLGRFTAGLIKGDEGLKKKGAREALGGALSMFGLKELFMEGRDRSPTSTSKLPKSISQKMRDIQERVWTDESIDNPQRNGMHAWHAGTNAALTNKLGPIGGILVWIGGLIHETPLDRASFQAEQAAQGTVNHIIDSVMDIVANSFGMITGLLLPKKWAIGVSTKLGNFIPGPGDPDPHGTGGGGYTGHPSDAWFQWPKWNRTPATP